MNECWQEEHFFFLGQAGDAHEQGGREGEKKGLEEGGKSAEREAVIEAIQHW